MVITRGAIKKTENTNNIGLIAKMALTPNSIYKAMNSKNTVEKGYAIGADIAKTVIVYGATAITAYKTLIEPIIEHYVK